MNAVNEVSIKMQTLQDIVDVVCKTRLNNETVKTVTTLVSVGTNEALKKVSIATDLMLGELFTKVAGTDRKRFCEEVGVSRGRMNTLERRFEKKDLK